MQKKKSSATPRKTTDARSLIFSLPPRPGCRRPIGGVRAA